MIIELLPAQVPSFWEAIKLATIWADEIEEKDRQVYLNGLLHSLLNNKSQCFVRLNDERKLQSLLLTKIIINKINGDKSLYVHGLYSWEKIEEKEWQEGFDLVRKFAEQQQCKNISGETRIPKLGQFAKEVGGREKSRMFVLDLEVQP